MKKSLLSLATLFVAMTSSAAELDKVTFPMAEQVAVSSYKTTWTGATSMGTWSFTNFNNNNNEWNYIKCGRKNEATTSTITSPAIVGKVESVVYTINKTSGVTSATFTVMNGEDVVSNTSVDLKAGDVTCTVSDAQVGYSYVLTIENEEVNANGTTQIDAITINGVEAVAAVAKPQFSVASGTYYEAQTVALTCETEGATIEYSFDGETYTTYTEALTIDETKTVYAKASKDGDESFIARADYTIAQSFASLAELCNLTPTKEGIPVTVALNNEVIDSIYVTKSGYRNGVYLTSGNEAKPAVEIYCKDVPEYWTVGGTVRGTVKGLWKNYNGTWEVCPNSWDGIKYTKLVNVAAGDYYIKNVETGKYLGGGNSWGTHASLVENGQIFTVVALENGKYKLDSHTYNNATDHFLGGDYIDNAGNEFVFSEADGGLNIMNGDMYVGVTTGTEVGTATDKDEVWQLITRDEMIATLASATKENPVNATFAIKNANFNRNHYRLEFEDTAWSITASNKNLGGGDHSNTCAESYHSTFTLTQTVTGLPKGVYSVTAQGFYRQDGSDNDNLPYFFAGEETAKFPLRTGTENSMSDASKSFTAGNYKIDPMYVLVENGEITLGAKNESNTNLWCIWDNFELFYLGADVDYNALKNAALVAKWTELKAEADSVYKEFELGRSADATIVAAFAAALKAEPEITTEALTAAIDALSAAMNAAVNSSEAYDAALEMAIIYNSFGKAANVSEDMMGALEAIYDGYENGTLDLTNGNPMVNAYKAAIANVAAQATDMTNLIANPSFENGIEGWTKAEGWQNSNPWMHVAQDNFPEKVGNNFVEGWVQGPNTHADEALTQTITLPAGKYMLTAMAKNMQQGNNEMPLGFYIFAEWTGEGALSEVTNIPERYATYFELEAQTEVTIGAKAENCTGNWICVDDFCLYQIKDGTPTAISGIEAANADKAIYNLNGQRMQKAQKGIYIIDNKKVVVK